MEEKISSMEQKQKFKVLLLEIYDFIAFVVFALGIVFLIKYFIFTPFTVVWHSMEPNIHNGDFLIVNEIWPRLNDYKFKRWDIIIFAPPGQNVDYIKRIIWLPWETVKIISGYVYICKDKLSGTWLVCKKLDEKYLPNWTITKTPCKINTFYVKPWTYFVLGDNRMHSTDSRCCFGVWCYSWASYLVPKQNIIWVPILRISDWKIYFY